MPVNVLVTSQKFYNEFRNGIGFVSNLGDFTFNLAGNVMEQMKFIQTIEIDWFAQATASNPWDVTASSLKRTTGSFRDDGFAVGDTADVFQAFATATPVYDMSISITSISADGKTLNFTVTAGVPTPPAVNYQDIGIRGTTPLTSLIYQFGLNDNGATKVEPESLVSGNDQGYYSATLGLPPAGPRDTSFQTMIRQGSFQGWQTGSMRARYVQNPTAYVQQFEIEHEFMIVPFYLEGELENLQNNIIPDILTGVNSLKYTYQPKFLTAFNNPNTEKSVDYTLDLGSVGWFNEGFNGFANIYQVKSVVYTDQATGDPVDGILISTKTKIVIRVENTSTPYVGAERFGVYVAYLPTADQYQDTTTTNLKQNFLYDRAMTSEGAPAVGGDDFITSLTATVVSGELEISMEMEYSASQKLFLAGENAKAPIQFVLGVEAGDQTLPSISSDRVVMIADVNDYDESADIPDLMQFDSALFYPHDEIIGVGTGYAIVVGYNEDGVVMDFDFYLDLNKSAVINSLTFIWGLEDGAISPSNSDIFVLDEVSIPVGTAPISGGVQQLDFDLTRGYDLEAGDQFNDLTIETGANVGGLQHYTGRYAQKMSWQDWIENLNIPLSYYDNTKPNNNRNLKSSNYLGDLRFFVVANVSGVSDLGVSGATNYIFYSNRMLIFDYDFKLNPGDFDCTIETFTEDGLTNTGGKPLTGENTLFRVTWSSPLGPIAVLPTHWGVHRIEVCEQPGYDIEEISTERDSPSNDLLIPIVGQTRLIATLVSGDIVTECLIDGSNIVSGVEYNLSARFEDTAGIPIDTKVTSPLGDTKVTSGGTTDNKITSS